MTGIGMPELLVIIFILCPIFIFIVFIFNAERQLRKDNDSIIREIKVIINELSKSQKLPETTLSTTSDHTFLPLKLDVSSRGSYKILSKPHQRFFIIRHWRGELPLPVSYWINVFLVNIVLIIALKEVPWDTFVTKFTKLCSTAVIALWVLLLIAAIWQLVGVWRSAKNYLSQGKSKLWGNLSKIAVVLGVIIGVPNFVSTGIPQITEYAKIATGNDPMGTYQLRVLRDATELEISGAIVFGLTDDVRRTLDAHPTIAIIHLNSQGGRVSEARYLRDLIGSRRLTTFTASGCFSACTLAYAAGKERLIEENANLGFHQYSFPGAKAKDIQAEYEKDKQDWVSRGFAKDFVNRAFLTPNNEMWRPTHRELFQAGFITRYPESDDVAVTGYKLGDLENIEAGFAKIPLFSAIKTFEPEIYRNMISEIRSGLQRGRSKAELREKLFPLLQSVFLERLPYASDLAIRSFATLFLEQMEILYSIDTSLCYDFIFGEGNVAKLDVSKYFSKELREKELQVINEVIRSAGAQKHRPPQEKEIEKQRAVVLKSLAQRYGDDVEMLVDPELGKKNKAKMCQLTYELYANVLGLPERESGPLLRFMFANEETVIPAKKIKTIEKPKKDDIVEKVKKNKEKDEESLQRIQEVLENIRKKAALNELQKRMAKQEVLAPSLQGSKLNEYYNTVWSSIKKEWTIPQNLLKERVDLETTIIIIIERDGKIQKSWFEKKSGNELYDQMAIRAIKKAEPFPPIPKEFSANTLEIGIRFFPD